MLMMRKGILIDMMIAPQTQLFESVALSKYSSTRMQERGMNRTPKYFTLRADNPITVKYNKSPRIIPFPKNNASKACSMSLTLSTP